MPKNKIITYEHNYLKVEADGISQLQFEKLVQYNERNDNKFFTVGNKRIKFCNYVGVIQVGHLSIEIYPKTDKSSNSQDKWKNCLLTMLHECRYIKFESLENAYLRLRAASLAEIFIESFLSEIWLLVRTGLVKKYKTIDNNVKFLKGRIIFSKNIQKNLINKERFFTSHQVYNYNNSFNQIIKKALMIISNMSVSNFLSLNAKNLLYHFEDIDLKEFDINDFEKLRFDRKTDRYRYSMNIAKLIILEYSPDISSGSDDILSILFDMNKLFEEFVYINLKRECIKSEVNNFTVKGQENKLFWSNKKIRPDIIIRDGKEIAAILDTKWKVLNECMPSDDDLKQIYVYNMHFGSKKSMLIYPKVTLDTQESTPYHKSEFAVEDIEHSCRLYFADLFDDEGKKKPFANDILGEIMN